MTCSEDYFDYLQRRSLIGLLYRRYWLYPKIIRNLSGHILDVGCGIGDFIAFYPNAIGVDINPHTVAWCRKRGLDARLMEKNILPFSDCSFNGLVLDNVLEHISEPVPLLNEMRRVLQPGGRAVIGVPGVRGYASDPDHKVFYDEDALLSVMNDTGFECNKTFHAPVRNAWLAQHIPQYCIYGIFERT